MNEDHAKLCSSPEWAAHIRDEVLPSLTRQVDLGDEMLELGPGPGAATEWLRHRVGRVTAAEVDEEAASRLAERYAGTNVEVIVADAASLGYPDDSFDSVGSFTMLHHVPTRASQDRILAEAFRVLRPGGVLVGSDSVASDDLRSFHDGDTYNPIDPAHLLGRLRALGFGRITIVVDGDLRFVALKPTCERTPATAREPGNEGSQSPARKR